MNPLSDSLLLSLVLAECGLLCAAFLTLMGHGAVARLRALRDTRLLARVRGVVFAALETSTDEEGALRRLVAALPVRLRVRLLREFLPGLGGAQRAWLVALMADAGLVAQAEAWCRSGRWWRRLQGVRLLTMLDTGDVMVPALLADEREEVRTAAVTWAAEHPTGDVIDQLLGMLAGEWGEGAFAVKDALVRIGPPAVDPLTRYLAEQSGGPLAAGLEVAAALADARMLGAALRALHDPSPHARALAAALTGAIGGAEAVHRLLEMTFDPDAGPRAASARALAKLGHWAAAPRVATMLRDPSWAVRREAGLALKALGAPGALLLRRALMDEDAFARDMARQVLDLPDRDGGRMSA